MRKEKRMFRYVLTAWFLAVTALAGGILRQQERLQSLAELQKISSFPEESSAFRAMHITKSCLKSFEDADGVIEDWDILAVYMLREDFDGTKAVLETEKEELRLFAAEYETYDKEAYERYMDAWKGVFSDLRVFPVPLSGWKKEADVSFENSWMFERNYGGQRGHEGTDLMPSIRKNNYYPIVSMTDGVIEKMGWLEKGGYRIGIRSPHGGYFYYAHLSSYAEGLAEYDTIQAGELLGYMGDTGYGKEGTAGMFDTHLHLGIYLKTAHYEELSVNPYWILKYMSDQRMYYNF